MPGVFYKEDELLRDKAEFERQKAAITAQQAELTAQSTALQANIDAIDSILAHISAGYPDIDQLDTPASFAADVSIMAGEYNIDLSWDAVTDATGYIIERSLNSDFSNSTEIYNDTTNSYTDDDPDLLPIRQYYYRVKAYADGFNDSEWATLSAYTYVQLDTPDNIVLASVDAGIATGTWDEVLFAQGYLIYRHTSNSFGGASQVLDVPTNSFSNTGLSSGTTYYYWIIAYSDNYLDSEAGAGGSILTA